jgi:hypothetical protein
MKKVEFSAMVQPLFDKVDCNGLMLVPRKIYYEWLRYLIPEENYLNKREAEFFLLPQFNSAEQAEAFCREFFDLFFQYKLKKWSPDPAFWPINRTFEMFQQWFEVRIACTVSSLK